MLNTAVSHIFMADGISGSMMICPMHLNVIRWTLPSGSVISGQPQHAARIVSLMAATLNNNGPLPLIPDR